MQRIYQYTKYLLWCVMVIYSLLWLSPSPARGDMTPLADNGSGETFFAISPQGTLVGWGGNDHGHIPSPSMFFHPYFARKTIMHNVVSVDTGYRSTMVVDEQNVLWGWGGDPEQLLLQEESPTFRRPVAVMEDVTTISMDSFSVAAIKTDGSLWIWGAGTPPTKLMDHAKYVLHVNNTYAINEEGTLFYFSPNTPTPYKGIPLLNGVSEIAYATRGFFQVLHTNGDVSLRAYQSPDWVVVDSAIDTQVRSLHRGGFLKEDGSLWRFGAQPIPLKVDEKVAYASANMVLTENGKLTCQGELFSLIPHSINTVSPLLRNLFLVILGLRFILNDKLEKKNQE